MFGSTDNLFKMSRFKNVKPRTDTHNGSRNTFIQAAKANV